MNLFENNHNRVSSARMYSPKSAWWKATMFIGSACLHSEVAFAATPNPIGRSAMLCTITPWYLWRKV